PCVVCAKTSLTSSTTTKNSIRFNFDVHICHPPCRANLLRPLSRNQLRTALFLNVLNANAQVKPSPKSRSCRRRHPSSQTEHVATGECHSMDHPCPRPCRQTCLREW